MKHVNWICKSCWLGLYKVVSEKTLIHEVVFEGTLNKWWQGWQWGTWTCLRHARLTRGYQGLSGAIRGYQGLSGAIRGYQGYQGLSGVIWGYQGYQGLSGVIRGYQGLSAQTMCVAHFALLSSTWMLMLSRKVLSLKIITLAWCAILWRIQFPFKGCWWSVVGVVNVITITALSRQIDGMEGVSWCGAGLDIIKQHSISAVADWMPF